MSDFVPHAGHKAARLVIIKLGCLHFVLQLDSYITWDLSTTISLNASKKTTLELGDIHERLPSSPTCSLLVPTPAFDRAADGLTKNKVMSRAISSRPYRLS